MPRTVVAHNCAPRTGEPESEFRRALTPRTGAAPRDTPRRQVPGFGRKDDPDKVLYV